MTTRVLYSWVHLSDLDTAGTDRAGALDSLESSIANPPLGCPPPQAVIVTGDIAGGGCPDEIARADVRLRAWADELGLGSDQIMTVPGDRDVDHGVVERDDGLRGDLEAARAGGADVDTLLDAQRLGVPDRFGGYLRLGEGHSSQPGAALSWRRRFGPDRARGLHLVGLNSALLARDEGEPRRLRLGARQLRSVVDAATNDTDDIVVVLCHHPPDWLSDAPESIRYAKARADVWLTGAYGQPGSRLERHDDGRELVYAAAGGEPRSWAYSFAAVLETRTEVVLRLWPRRWAEHRFIEDTERLPAHESFVSHVLRSRPAMASPRPVNAEVPASSLSVTAGLEPLRVHVLAHPASELASHLAVELQRRWQGAGDPLDLGIPVRIWREADAPSRHLHDAERSVVVALCDRPLLDDPTWVSALGELAERVGRGPERRLAAVDFDEGVRTIPGVADHQTIDASRSGPGASLPVWLGHVLTHHLVRTLRSTTAAPAPRLLVFISHAKRDGEGAARELLDRLQTRDIPRLDTFFDRDAIDEGFRFDDQIDSTLERQETLLLVVQTDAFASREWCRREVLGARIARRPVVVVHAVDRGERNGCAYFGMSPVLRWAPNRADFWSLLWRTLLDEALRFELVPRRLAATAATQGRAGALCVPYPPDLHALHDAPPSRGDRLVLYPEGWLMALRERTALETMLPHLKVRTPCEAL